MVRAAAPPELHPSVALPSGFSVIAICGKEALIWALATTAGRTSMWMKRVRSAET